jgi:hypothetical protein
MPYAEQKIAELVEVYRKAYLRLLTVIATKEAKGNSVFFERSLLAEVNRILLKLDTEVRGWAEEVIPKLYQESTEEVYQAFIAAGITPEKLNASFAKINQSSVAALVDNFYDNLTDAHRFVARRIRDSWRKAQLQQQLVKETTGQTIREAKKEFVQRVGESGLGAFTDKRGRVWRLDSYAEMAIRSVTAETQNTGLLNQIQAFGYDLVKMTEHNTLCEICAPLQGRVYSISGNHPEYPSLSNAHGHYANVHPNCRHRLIPYVPEYDENAAEMKAKSNRPFDIDPRTAKQKEAYEAEQQKNRERRETRKQWEKYKTVLPNDTPGLAQFTRMKNANSEKYQDLKSLLREV